MVAHGRVELLAHPLSQKYLQMKWNSYGKYFHLANLLFYSVYLVFVTLYSYLLMTIVDPSEIPDKVGKCFDVNSSNKTDNATHKNTASRQIDKNLQNMMDTEASMLADIIIKGVYMLSLSFAKFKREQQYYSNKSIKFFQRSITNTVKKFSKLLVDAVV